MTQGIKPTPPAIAPTDSVFGRTLKRMNEHEFNWNDLWVWYARMLAILTLLRGFGDWAVICGFVGSPSGSFETEPVAAIILTVLGAILAMFAATGLWMLTAWGAVLWLLSMFMLIFVDIGFALGWIDFSDGASRTLSATLVDVGLVATYFAVTTRAGKAAAR